MVRALTKKTKKGVPYTRRPDIEQILAQAVREAPATLRQRALISDPSDPRYLPAEALVHLGRNALRTGDRTTADAVIGCLGRRCMRNLQGQIRPTTLFDADEVRGQVLCELYDLFADEVNDVTSNTLDFYEAQFNAAFATLRAGVIRATHRRNARFVAPISAADQTEDGDEMSDVGERQDESPDSDPALQAEGHDLLRFIQALPLEEREAVVWKRFGFKTESNDTAETTVATLCGVSGRAIRGRLNSARTRLKRMEEES
jgi:hypothetical protein